MRLRHFSYDTWVHRAEWLGISVVLAVLCALPLDVASNAMGFFGRCVGKYLKVTRVARRNLSATFPDWTSEKIDKVINGMWDNLARYVAEFPHIAPMNAKDFGQICEIQGAEHLEMARSSGRGTLFFSCHMANWELAAKASWALGIRASIVYRPLNNPFMEKLVNRLRNQYQLKALPKNTSGGRELIKTLKSGNPVAFLADQKMNSGVPIPFFGRDAMTAAAIAEIALRYDFPILPARVERLEGKTTRFRVTYYPPIAIQKTVREKEDVRKILITMHQIMEQWITERPEQWFWVHKRWG